MAGTKEGGKKAVATIYQTYGEDYFSNIGRKGGSAGRGPDYKGGFASSHELAVRAGRKGGLISKRGPARDK